jgi:tetratricopeptide (TPR) repeat protein
MKGPSEKPRSRKIVLLVSFIAATILTFQAIRIWVADYRVHSNRIDQMERSVALEPENAAAWDRLGRAKETDFVNPDPAGAVADFEKAVALVPLSATYWTDLASAYESIGNIPLAREAFSRARAAYPASAQVAWSYGNFLLRQGDDASGFAQINHAVQVDPSLAMPAVSQAWHKTQDGNVLLNQVLPATQDAYFQAIDFMAANGQPAAALVIWGRLSSQSGCCSSHCIGPQMRFSLESNCFDSPPTSSFFSSVHRPFGSGKIS